MTYEEFVSDLPRQRIVFTSAEENEETMKRLGIDQEVRQLGNGKFRSDLAVRSTAQVELYADRFNTAVSVHLDAPEGTVGFVFPRTDSGRFLASGQHVGNNKLIVVRHGEGTDIVGPALIGTEDFAISEEKFVALSRTLCPSFSRPVGTTIIEGNTPKLNAIRGAILHLVAHPEHDVSDEELSDLLAVTIAWMGRSAAYRGPKPLTISPTRARVAKQAQEYIEEHYDGTVRIEDLCRVTGVGVRTLQRCFREYFDVTISEFLKTERLNSAHRSLGASQSDNSTVAEIAMQHGFTHLGRFSVEFRKRFGESPRTTLATRNGSKSMSTLLPLPC
jgi:AraC-like DNA-binding protein